MDDGSYISCCPDTERNSPKSRPEAREQHMRQGWTVKHGDHRLPTPTPKSGRDRKAPSYSGMTKTLNISTAEITSSSTENPLPRKAEEEDGTSCFNGIEQLQQQKTVAASSGKTSDQKRPKTVLDLPPEVLIEIFKKLDPCSAFIVATDVNRYFYHTARNSQALWDHQILNLPGVPRHDQKLTMDETYAEFVLKATGELCPGRQRPDFYRFNTASRLDTKLSQFVNESSHSKTPMLLAVEEHLPAVTMYSLPSSLDPIEPWRRIRLPPEEDDIAEHGASPKLLRVAYHKGRLGLLYETLGQNRTRQLLKRSTGLAVPVFYLALTELRYIRARDATLDGCETHTIQPGVDMDPFTFSISDQESWAIGWHGQSNGKTKVTHQLRRRGSQFFPIDVKSDPFCPLTNIKFALRGSKLNLFFGGLPVHQKFCSFTPSVTMQITEPPESNLVLNDQIYLVAIDLRVGMPFYSDHDSQPEDGICKHSYLALATTTDGSRAYVLGTREVLPRMDCRHPSNPEYGRLISEWKLVGRLDGYEPPASSAGLKIATSKCGRRIAIANWKSLRIWTLHLNEIRENDAEFYVRRRHASPDSSDSHQNEDTYMEDIDDGGGDNYENVIESFEVDTYGDVIFDLMWSGPKTLYALSDRGVCRWYFGHDCKKRYEEGLLPEFY